MERNSLQLLLLHHAAAAKVALSRIIHHETHEKAYQEWVACKTKHSTGLQAGLRCADFFRVFRVFRGSKTKGAATTANS